MTIPSYERPAYDKISRIHHTLLDLKNNRANYIASRHVFNLYHLLLEALAELKTSRKDEELKGLTLIRPSPTDLLADDTWQLVLLCFMTCGLNQFAPATYAALLTVHRMLEHLREGQAYTQQDLKTCRLRLADIRSIIDANIGPVQDVHWAEENLLLRTKLQKCEYLCQQLEQNFHRIPVDLEPIFRQLVATRKEILLEITECRRHAYSSSSNHATADVPSQIHIHSLRNRLKQIRALRNPDGRFHSEAHTGEDVEDAIHIVLNGLLDDCADLLDDLAIETDLEACALDALDALHLDSSSNLASTALEHLFIKASEIKTTLSNLLLTSRWTMRETDIYVYQKSLKEIDDARTHVMAELGSDSTSLRHIRKKHLLVLFLLRRCYNLVYKLLEALEPVSESLQPLHNQLSSVRRCLLDIKRLDGFNRMRELYPFQLKLASLDDMRVDGKFMVNGQIPEGQGTLNALLAECFDILHELIIGMEEREEEEGGEDIVITRVEKEQLHQKMSSMVYGGDFTNSKVEKQYEVDVEQKRSRYHGFGEADYDLESASTFEDDLLLLLLLLLKDYDNDYY